MIPTFVISSVGMVAGLAAFLLGVAQLTCEHHRSALLPRLTTFTLTILAGWTAIDSWDAWSGDARACRRQGRGLRRRACPVLGLSPRLRTDDARR